MLQQVTGTLTAATLTATGVLGPIQTVDNEERNGAASIQIWSAGYGSDTIVLEGSNNYTPAQNGVGLVAGDWQLIYLTNPGISTSKDQASIATGGALFWAEIVSVAWIRARMSVASGGNTKLTLTYRTT